MKRLLLLLLLLPCSLYGQAYNDVVTNSRGQPIAGASYYVYSNPGSSNCASITGTLSTLYTDPSLGTPSGVNPVISDQLGRIQVYTNAGTYCVKIVGYNITALQYPITLGGGGGGSGVTIQTNGVNNSVQTSLNFLNSAATNGQTFTFTNTSSGNVQLGVTGTLNNAGLTNPSVTVQGATCTLGSTCNVNSATLGNMLISGGAGNALNSATNFTYASGVLTAIPNGSLANTTIFQRAADPGSQANYFLQGLAANSAQLFYLDQVGDFNTNGFVAGQGGLFYQASNGSTAMRLTRFTDSAPTGYFLAAQRNDGAANLFTVDVSGNTVVQNLTISGTCTGCGASSGNTTSTSMVAGNLPVATGVNSLTDSTIAESTVVQTLAGLVSGSPVIGGGSTGVSTLCGSNCIFDNLGDLNLNGFIVAGTGPSLEEGNTQLTATPTLDAGYDYGTFVYNKSFYCLNSDGSSCLLSGVGSFTGDGVLLTNSASTGAVTAILATAGGHKWFGNATASTAAPSYQTLTTGDLPTSTAFLNAANVWSSTDNFTGATITVPTKLTSDSSTAAASTAFVQQATGSTPFITVNSGTADPVCGVLNQTPWTCAAATTKTYFATSGTIPFATANGKIDAIHHGLNLQTQFDALWPSSSNGWTLTLNAGSALSGQTCTGCIALWSSGATTIATGSALTNIQVNCTILVNGSTATTLSTTCLPSNGTRVFPSAASAVVTSVPNTATNWILVWSITWTTNAQAEGINLDSMVGTYIP